LLFEATILHDNRNIRTDITQSAAIFEHLRLSEAQL
jgi:hypothetical protein